MPESLGRYLRRERRMRDVALQQISEETKIKLSVLEALEEDRFEALPSPAIVKGFLRAYAEIVGLSGQLLVLRYESILEEQGASSKGALTRGMRDARAPRRWLALLPVVSLLLALLGLGAGIHLLTRDEPETPQETAARKAREAEAARPVVYRRNYLRELSGTLQDGTPANLAGAVPPELVPPRGGVHLLVEAVAPVSVRVVLDTGEAETIELVPGQAVARYALRGAVLETPHPGRVIVRANGRELFGGVAGAGPARFILSAGSDSGDEQEEEEDGALPALALQVVPLGPGVKSFIPFPNPFLPD